MVTLEGASLREEVLRWLEEHRRQAARELFEGVRFTVRRAVRSWSASDGERQAHAVEAHCDASALAGARALPSRLDDLREAIAATLARVPGEGLAELSLRWDGTLGVHATAGHYREGPSQGELWLRAVLLLLGASSSEARRWVEASDARSPRELAAKARGAGALGERVLEALGALGLGR